MREFELYIGSAHIREAFHPLSKHMQITGGVDGWGGIYDSKLAIGESVAHYVSV